MKIKSKKYIGGMKIHSFNGTELRTFANKRWDCLEDNHYAAERNYAARLLMAWRKRARPSKQA